VAKRKKSKTTGKSLLGYLIVALVSGIGIFSFQKLYEASQSCGNVIGCLGCGGIGGVVIFIVVLVREYLRM
jgi:hypothetical protein